MNVLLRKIGLLPLLMVVLAIGIIEVGLAESKYVIIDTDPAMGYLFRDIDDGVMLFAALGAEELKILGITTVFGNVSQTLGERKAREIINVTGREKLDIYSGARAPLEMGADNARDRDWSGTAWNSARFIAKTVLANPNKVTIYATGPLTNVAAAIMLEPRVADLVSEIVVVGGSLENSEYSRSEMPWDLNFGSDLAAASLVFGSSAPLAIIHIALCMQLETQNREFKEFLGSSGVWSRYLRNQTFSWRLVKRGRIVLWDVIGLGFLLNEQWFSVEETGVELIVGGESDGSFRPAVWIETDDSGSRRARIPNKMENIPAFWNWLSSSVQAVGAGS